MSAKARGRVSLFSTASRTTSYLLGGVVIAVAVASGTGSFEARDFAQLAQDVFGPTFTVLYLLLVATTLFCWVRLGQLRDDSIRAAPWLESGMHAASGVATLALTYTLLGISLGIGSLADQPLTTETIQTVIQGLTGHFSMAFMTTVVGLPSAAILRALLLISHASWTASSARTLPYYPGENS
ncbi:MAG: hypothetical protein HOE62_04430 [Alphaproteobacteria bacterium]|jgi:hypothetical protein|nr:hypothetical protein [Alphaproteobacteria bacterium]MBT4017170.1 hypothetical protein [Alphaproteobacteria bacterium]MBT4966256.1 hypothetical protein [Alphaproteobacteria bacterium]MBT5159181.1 hypothetical protein [Alphaproteobacteria bacterium]MBT5917102.1 hypothetical protein [Alphaproteobacteria bacterium]